MTNETGNEYEELEKKVKALLKERGVGIDYFYNVDEYDEYYLVTVDERIKVLKNIPKKS